MNASGVDLTSDVPIAVSAKFSRPASGEKRALACEQIATKQGAQINSAAAASDTLNANDLIATIDASSALNASGTEGALAAIDATGASTTLAAIGTIDASNVPNLDGSFAATRTAKASAASNATHTDEANAALNISAVSCKNEPQAELKNELNHAVEPQAELQNKSNPIKSQIGHRSELSHDELQAKHQGKLNRAERQDKRQSEPSYTEPQNERQSKPCAAEPQDVLILLSLGAFDFPQQCFIRANASGTRYFIRRPLPTRENHAAHQKISEIFSQWQR